MRYAISCCLVLFVPHIVDYMDCMDRVKQRGLDRFGDHHS